MTKNSFFVAEEIMTPAVILKLWVHQNRLQGSRENVDFWALLQESLIP